MIEKIKFKYYVLDTSMKFLSTCDTYEDARTDMLFYKEMYPEKRFMIVKFVEETK